MKKRLFAAAIAALLAFGTITGSANSTTQTIGIGSYHLGLVTADGQLVMWGVNEYGEFGTGETGLGTNRYDFTPSATDVAAVVCGYYNGTAILKKDGTFWATGRNDQGQLGNGTTANSAEFVKIDDNVVKIGAGMSYYIYLKKDGSLWGVGDSGNRQMVIIPDGATAMKSPVKIADGVKDFSTYANNTGYITTKDELYMFGANAHGQLGVGHADGSYDMELPVKVLDNVRSVSVGHFYTLAVKNDNTLWSWGINDYGQLLNGQTSYDDGYVPVYAPAQVAENVLTACAGDDESAYITTDHQLYFAGHNLYNEAGHITDLGGYVQPVKLADNVAQIAMHDMTVYTTLDGKTYTGGGTINELNVAVEGFKEQPYVVAQEQDYEIGGSVITLQIGSDILAKGDSQTVLDVPAQIIDDRTMVPLRAIFEALGAAVEWNGENQTVTAVRADITVEMQIGSNTLTKNGTEVTLDVPAQLVNDRTLVPARAVAEAFSCTVDWDGATQTVTITE